MSSELQLVVALSDNWVIGKAGQLPWYLPEDLRHFKSITLNHPVVMGRKTFESIGRVLPQRRNVLISTTFRSQIPGLEVVSSLKEARELLSSESVAPMIIGGARLYAEALPFCRILHLTRVHLEVSGDTFFPRIPFEQFTLREQHNFFSEKLQCSYSFETWERN